MAGRRERRGLKRSKRSDRCELREIESSEDIYECDGENVNESGRDGR